MTDPELAQIHLRLRKSRPFMVYCANYLKNEIGQRAADELPKLDAALVAIEEDISSRHPELDLFEE